MNKHLEPLQKLSASELQKKAQEIRGEIADLRRGVVTGELSNNQIIRAKRRELARVLTLLTTASKAVAVEAKTVEKKVSEPKATKKEEKK